MGMEIRDDVIEQYHVLLRVEQRVFGDQSMAVVRQETYDSYEDAAAAIPALLQAHGVGAAARIEKTFVTVQTVEATRRGAAQPRGSG